MCEMSVIEHCGLLKSGSTMDTVIPWDITTFRYDLIVYL